MKKGNSVLILFLSVVILLFLNIVIYLKATLVLGLICSAVTLLFLSLILLAIDKKEKLSKKLRQQDNFMVESSTRKMMLEFSIPCIMCKENGEIVWYNTAASRMFEDDELIGSDIYALVSDLGAVKGENGEGEAIINLKNYEYSFIGCETGGKHIYLISFRDITVQKSLSVKCSAVKTVSCFVSVDNYHEVMSGISGNEIGKLSIEIEAKLVGLAERCDGSIQKLERDRYYIVMDMEHLSVLIADKFSILQEMKKIRGTNEIPVTISIGVGCSDESVSKGATSARAALELALGRGGDQAVVKIADDYRFFGTSSTETEKKTKVRARVMAQALTEIIGSASQVVIMGHKNMDADAFGAAIGVFSIADSLGVRARIIVDENDRIIQNEIAKFSDLEEYKYAFIPCDKAFSMMNDKTVTVILDTHQKDRTECPELLGFASKIVVIDHHRKCKDFIKNTILTYHETYASSTSEMVTEILQYTENGKKIKKQEAEALYAGITLDSKNFTVKTGVRTFDAASFLRKRGVDILAVREMFKVDFDSFKKRMAIIDSAKVYREITCIAYAKGDVQTAAAASDELLSISGIKASFVICDMGEVVHISARSTGEINVQLILEALGGGGHMTVAGTQIENSDVLSAENMLTDAIDTYFKDKYITD